MYLPMFVCRLPNTAINSSYRVVAFGPPFHCVRWCRSAWVRLGIAHDGAPQVTLAGLRRIASEFMWLPPGSIFCKHVLPHGAFAYALVDTKANGGSRGSSRVGSADDGDWGGGRGGARSSPAGTASSEGALPPLLQRANTTGNTRSFTLGGSASMKQLLVSMHEELQYCQTWPQNGTTNATCTTSHLIPCRC
jgi:hypothetical protein